MLVDMASDYGTWVPLVSGRGHRWRKRGGLITLNVVGWSALVALGSLVSVLAALVMPLPVALALGTASSSAAYAAEWLVTRRDMKQNGGGPPAPGGGPSGIREPRPPATPLPTLDASRLPPH